MNKSFLKLCSVAILIALLFESCSYMLPYRDDFQCQKGKNSGVCGSVSEIYDLSSDMDSLRLRTLDDNEAKIKKAEAKENLEVQRQQAINKFTHQKLREMVEATEIRNIQNEHPVIFRFFLDEDKRVPNSEKFVWNNDYTTLDNEKTSQNTSKKQNSSKTQVKKNAKQTKSINKPKQINTDVNALNANLKAWQGENNSSVKEANNINALFANVGDKNASNAVGQNLGALNSNLLTNQTADENKTSSTPIANNGVDCSASGGARKEINAQVKVCVYAANIRKNPSCKAEVLRIANKNEVLFALYEQDGWVKLSDGTYIHKSIITQD